MHRPTCLSKKFLGLYLRIPLKGGEEERRKREGGKEGRERRGKGRRAGRRE
jgi:hypothetical protein